MPVNEYGQMIGEPVDDTPGVLPSLVRIEGRYTVLEALSVEKHAKDLLAVYGPDSPREMWTYLFQPPVENLEELIVSLKQMIERKDPSIIRLSIKRLVKHWVLFRSCVLTKPIAPLKLAR